MREVQSSPSSYGERDISISVVIPLYNKSATIRRALESVLRQSIPVQEIIVLDDGSTDDGLASVKCLTDPRIVCIAHKNCGVARTRNIGVSMAKTEYVAFLDADDYWPETYIASLVSAIGKHPDCILYVASPVSSCQYTWAGRALESQSKSFSGAEFLRMYSRDMNIINTPSATVNVERFMRAGGFPEECAVRGEDIVAWIRCGLQGSVAFTGCVGATVDRSASDYRLRRAAFPAPAYHFYPMLSEIRQEFFQPVLRIVRRNLLMSMVASGGRAVEMRRCISERVAPYDPRFAVLLRLLIACRVMPLVSFVRQLRNVIKQGPS